MVKYWKGQHTICDTGKNHRGAYEERGVPEASADGGQRVYIYLRWNPHTKRHRTNTHRNTDFHNIHLSPSVIIIGERERVNLVVRTARFFYTTDRVRRVSAHARLLCMLHACVLV